MLKSARSMAALDARGNAEPWPAGWAIRNWRDTRFHGLRGRWRAHGLLLATAFLALGVLAGLAAGRLTANAAAHRDGACNALQMAAALGYLDDRQQRVVMRTLATAVNPDVDLFPGGHRATRQACDAVAGRS